MESGTLAVHPGAGGHRRALALAPLLSILSLILWACAAPLESAPAPGTSVPLFVRNSMDRDVAIFVDGTEIVQVPSGVRLRNFAAPIANGGMGLFEARTVQGALIKSFQAFGPADFFGQRGYALFLDCGFLAVWVGQDLSVEWAPPRGPLPPCP
jgi:hypothetical protein